MTADAVIDAREVCTPGFVIRLVIVGVTFVLMSYYAVDMVVHALLNRPFVHGSPGSGYYSWVAPPSIGEALFVVAIGPGAALAVGGVSWAYARSRRRTRVGRARLVTCWVLALVALQLVGFLALVLITPPL